MDFLLISILLSSKRWMNEIRFNHHFGIVSLCFWIQKLIELSKGFPWNWNQLFKQKDDSWYWIRSLHYVITLKKGFGYLKSYDKHKLSFELLSVTLISASNVTPLNRNIATENSLFFFSDDAKMAACLFRITQCNCVSLHFIELHFLINIWL